MVQNRYFNFRNRASEQNLVEDLIIEAIQIFGEDVIYLPRDRVLHDKIYGEDVLSQFEDYIKVEGYIKDVNGFQGDGDIFRKFGIDIKDQLTMSFSRYRFAREADKILDPPVPREGDIIFFPESETMFEIKFVEHEKVFYQLGTLYVYDCQCELFVASREDIKTGIEFIDEAMEESEYSQYLDFPSGANAYNEDEVVYQGVDEATATFKATIMRILSDTRIEVKDIKGEAVIGDPLYGVNSGAIEAISAIDDLANDESGVNATFDEEASEVLDFDEHNPFGEPEQ